MINPVRLSGKPVVPRIGVLVRELDNEVLILDTVVDRVHRLNSSAAVVWRMYEGGAPDRVIADALVATFEVTADAALADVRQTIETLHALRVVSRSAGAADAEIPHPDRPD
jgi:hypothetical protein